MEGVEEDMPQVLSGVERGTSARHIEAIMSMFSVMPEIEPYALYSVMFKRFGIMQQEFVPLYQSMISAGMIEEVGDGERKKVRKKKPN